MRIQRNKFLIAVFLYLCVNFSTNTFLTAAFFETYWETIHFLFNFANKLIATTDFQVPGHHLTINTLFFQSLERIANFLASSYTAFWSSIKVNSLFPSIIHIKESANAFEGLILPFSILYIISFLSQYFTYFFIKSCNFCLSASKNIGACSIYSE